VSVKDAFLWELSGKHKNSKFQGIKNGVDFNTKKCSFYRGQRQILTLGLFLGAALKFASSFLVGIKMNF